jgi:hypothetical protein
MRHRSLSAEALSVVEILVLAPLAAVLAFWVVPNAFEIDWSCVSALGVEGTRGDSFAQVVAVAGTIGWVGVFLGVLAAQIAERPRLAAALPIAWFALLVAGMTIAAAVVGPAPCPV